MIDLNAECKGKMIIECDKLCLKLNFLSYIYELPPLEELINGINLDSPMPTVPQKSPCGVGTFIKCFLVILDLIERCENKQECSQHQFFLTEVIEELRVRGEQLPEDAKETENYVSRIIDRFFSTEVFAFRKECPDRWKGGKLIDIYCSKQWGQGNLKVWYTVQHVMEPILDECELNALRRLVGYPIKDVIKNSAGEENDKNIGWENYIVSKIGAMINYGSYYSVFEIPTGSQMKMLAKLAGENPDDVNEDECDKLAREAREENEQIRKNPYKVCELIMSELLKNCSENKRDAIAKKAFRKEVELFVRNRFEGYVRSVQYLKDNRFGDGEVYIVELWNKRYAERNRKGSL